MIPYQNTCIEIPKYICVKWSLFPSFSSKATPYKLLFFVTMFEYNLLLFEIDSLVFFFYNVSQQHILGCVIRLCDYVRVLVRKDMQLIIHELINPCHFTHLVTKPNHLIDYDF
jgi:hypothetical protein